ncbi:MAG TPA: DUF1843 domain-containing protein [Allosphingosinicella sp.]|jgi:hypothetical protein
MGTPPKKVATTARATASKVKLKDPGRLFYKVAVRDSIERGDLAEMKGLLATAKDLQKTGIDKLVADLETAIKRAQ